MDKHCSVNGEGLFHCHVDQGATYKVRSHMERTQTWVGCERDGVTETSSIKWQGRLPSPKLRQVVLLFFFFVFLFFIYRLL